MTTTGMDAFELEEEDAPKQAPEGDDDKWGALRLIGLVALIAAFSGFVYLAYMQGVRNGQVGAPPVIVAENGPYKERPVDPGGRTFENADKKVFERVESETGTSHARISPPALDSDNRVVDPQSGQLVVAESAVQPAPRPAGITGTTERPANAKGGPISEKTMQSPQRVADTPAPPVRPQAETVRPIQSASIEPQREIETASRVPAGSYLIQIASYRDRPMAEEAWNKLIAKHSDLVSSLSPNYQSANVSGRGTYYRLRIGPFTSKDEASAVCSALKARQQDCLVVKS